MVLDVNLHPYNKCLACDQPLQKLNPLVPDHLPQQQMPKPDGPGQVPLNPSFQRQASARAGTANDVPAALTMSPPSGSVFAAPGTRGSVLSESVSMQYTSRPIFTAGAVTMPGRDITTPIFVPMPGTAAYKVPQGREVGRCKLDPNLKASSFQILIVKRITVLST